MLIISLSLNQSKGSGNLNPQAMVGDSKDDLIENRVVHYSKSQVIYVWNMVFLRSYTLILPNNQNENAFSSKGTSQFQKKWSSFGDKEGGIF